MESFEKQPQPKLFLDKYQYEFEALDAVQDNLAGSYNQEGIDAWWYRPRTELGGETPVEYWKIDPRKVIELSEKTKA